jgi:hypothetical protein
MMHLACTSCRCLSNAWAYLGNTRALLHAIGAKSFFISMAHDPQRAMRHVLAPEPTCEAGHDPKLSDACQRWSPPRRRGGVQCRGTRGSVGALLEGETGSGASGHVTALEPS